MFSWQDSFHWAFISYYMHACPQTQTSTLEILVFFYFYVFCSIIESCLIIFSSYFDIICRNRSLLSF